jgi:cytochrome c oxidase subunit III
VSTGSEVVRLPHAETSPAETGHGHPGHADTGMNTALLGMLLFIGSEVMFFAGLFAAYFNARAAAPQWPPDGMEGIIQPELFPIWTATIILVISSFTMQWGVWRIRKGDRRGLNRAVGVTLLLGIVFLVLQVYDYWHLLDHYDFGINSGIYGTLFYTMTGFHGAHVFGGVIGLAVIFGRGVAGQFSARNHIAVEAVSAYWHFVDVVWIALFFTLYFLH